MEEYHHPLWALYAEYPAAVGMELRMMEQLMGCKVERREVAGGRGGPAKVVYAMATL
jgi:hypothetical protein